MNNAICLKFSRIDVIKHFKMTEGCQDSDPPPVSDGTLLGKLFMLFEFPETSKTAFAIGIVSVFMTLVSIILFCIETLPVFAQSHCVADEAPNFLDPFFIIETVCTLWFTLEIVVRFVGCPSRVDFCKDVKNAVDVTAILPYYVTFFNVVSTMSCASAKSSASLAFLRVTRLIRIFKLTKHSIGLQVYIFVPVEALF